MQLEFSYLLNNFSIFYRLFLVFGLFWFKNFDLNIENVLFLNWNLVFNIMIYNIFNELLILILKIGKGGGAYQIHFADLTKYSGIVHMVFFFNLMHLSFNLQCLNFLK